MKDLRRMKDILREMAQTSNGQRIVVRPLGMSDTAQHEVHQVELLFDLGLVTPVSEGVVRITAAGYDFLEEGEGAQEEGTARV